MGRARPALGKLPTALELTPMPEGVLFSFSCSIFMMKSLFSSLGLQGKVTLT